MAIGAAPEDRGNNSVRHAVWPWLAAAVALVPLPASATDFSPWIGSTRPSLDLDALGGGRVALAAYAGRPVVLHFFATWCPPCIEELPQLARMAAGNPDVAVLVVDVGEPSARVEAFFAAHPPAFPVLLDRERGAALAWQVFGLPTSILLDSGLTPRLAAAGEVDWTDPGLLARLNGLAPAPADVRRRQATQREENDPDAPA